MKAFFLSVCIFLLALPAFSSEDLGMLPKTPAAVTDLVFARPFSLEKGFTYDWSMNHQLVRSGTLVVLKVDPALVYPRDSAEPVLYVGNQTAQRLNQGHESGFVIAIVPGDVDLTKDPIWFGTPGLPERVNANTIRSERALADKAQIRPFSANKIASLIQEPLQATDLATLLREDIANLVLQYSPQETKLVETWRLPVARAVPQSR
jgi:hypothetical protein